MKTKHVMLAFALLWAVASAQAESEIIFLISQLWLIAAWLAEDKQ